MGEGEPAAGDGFKSPARDTTKKIIDKKPHHGEGEVLEETKGLKEKI
jgi:hypothetical protein